MFMAPTDMGHERISKSGEAKALTVIIFGTIKFFTRIFVEEEEEDRRPPGEGVGF